MQENTIPKMKNNFTIGYYKLHDEENINFQLNRTISNGGRLEDIQEIAPKIKDFADWKRELVIIAEQALAEGRTLNAAMYYRAAEFFVLPSDPDKEILFDKFIELFHEINKNAINEKVEIPYENSFLPAYHLKEEQCKGTIVIHGGYDSFMEEIYRLALFFRDKGYEVILFEGPGQGTALIKNKLHMTHEWEKPVKVILDHFKLDNVILLGISLGGYLGLRAAAFEPRISKVIAYDVMYDFFEVLSFAVADDPRIKELVENLLENNKVKLLNKTFQGVMKNNLLANWGINHGMHVFGVETPFEFIETARLYSTAEISNRITQDVLLLAGSKDHFIPLQMFYKQIEALKNIKSLTCRLFTEKEHAAGHCQYGNLKLVLDFILNWIEITK
ncbi:MAG: alpha/beta fold hydrolase [Promethearchaeota archaeon]